MRDSKEETIEKLALLKLRGWRFIFYPADLVEVYRPNEVVEYGSIGQFFGGWQFSSKVHWFYEEEFGDG